MEAEELAGFEHRACTFVFKVASSCSRNATLAREMQHEGQRLAESMYAVREQQHDGERKWDLLHANMIELGFGEVDLVNTNKLPGMQLLRQVDSNYCLCSSRSLRSPAWCGHPACDR